MQETDTPEQPAEQEAPIPHVICPMTPPELDGLTVAELQTLRNYIHGQSREARKKSVQTISKVPELYKAWLETLRQGMEQAERVRAMSLFHAELARHPDAFVRHMYANSLIKLSEMIREDMLARAGEPPAKKSRARS